MSKKYKNPKAVKFPKMMPIRVTNEMYDKITVLARRMEWDRSKLVRHAISHFIVHQEQSVDLPEPEQNNAPSLD